MWFFSSPPHPHPGLESSFNQVGGVINELMGLGAVGGLCEKEETRDHG